MATTTLRSAEIWALAARQHFVVSRLQLRAHGLTASGIRHRLAEGRLHVARRGVYAVGRPAMTRDGELMAAVLACGHHAVLSHRGAGELLGILGDRADPIEITIPAAARRRQRGIRTHRRDLDPAERVVHHGIPVTSPICTLIDLATVLSTAALTAAINQADKLDLIDPETLRVELDRSPSRRGKAKLRKLLDRQTFTLTDSELERRIVPIARAAGLPPPLTQHWLCGFRIDFYWPDLDLVVETDGLRYHRTAGAQARDRERDQVLTAAGLTVLRFTHAQVTYERGRVTRTLAATARRLRASGAR